MISKAAVVALAAALAATPMLVSSSASAQVVEQDQTTQQGQWVQLADGSWIWVPADAGATVVDGVPYAYYYVPTFGWGWYASPWGYGHYHQGPWVAHPYPYGFRRFYGGGYRGYYHGGFRGGGGGFHGGGGGHGGGGHR